MEITETLKDPATEEEIPKSTFIVYFQGEQLKIRVKKICEGFVISLFHPEMIVHRIQMIWIRRLDNLI